jgi:uncharacterized cupin superfamily protein
MHTPRELLTAAAIAAMAGKTTTHPLNENALRSSKSLGDACGLTQLGFHLVTLLPGRDSTEFHRHHFEEECVYILSGRGEAQFDETRHVIAAGDFLGYPRGGVAHAITNSGDVPLVMLVAGQRLAHDVCDYPRQHKRLFINGADENLVDFADFGK